MELRPYQRECIETIPERGSFLIQMATGLGKTVCFSSIPRHGRMLILSHRDELVRQPAKYFTCPFGIEQAAQRSNGEEVVSASVPSLVRRLNRFKPDDFDIIITDEAHHAAAPSYRKIYDYFKPRLHLGFTATPNRGDGQGLDDIFEDIIFERDLEWGIRNGYLSDIYCLRAEVDYDLSGVASRMGDYSPDDLEEAVNIKAANKAVAEVYQKYAAGQTLIFCVSVSHARDLAAEIPGAVAVLGGEERSGVLDMFRRSELRCLTNCMVFTEGTDLPCIETVMIARPTQNPSLYAQMVGRGCRLYPGKERMTLIDCVGVTSKADICTAPSLLGIDMHGTEDAAEDAFDGDIFDLPKKVEESIDNPRCWIRNVEYVDLWARARRYNLHGVNYFKTPGGDLVLSKPKFRIPAPDKLGRVMWNGVKIPLQKALDEVYVSLRDNHADSRSIWDLQYAERWGEYRATDKQKALISRMLPDFDASGLTKFEAGQIITRMTCGRR